MYWCVFVLIFSLWYDWVNEGWWWGENRRAGDNVHWLSRVCVCVSHESWLDMNPGVSCSRQSRRLSHQTYTIDLNHETDIKHQIMAVNYASSFSFLFFPSSSLTPLCFMQYFFLTQINREWKQTEQRKHNSHASHSLSPLRTHTILVFITSEDTVLTCRLN